MNVAGPAAERIDELLWAMTVLGTVVFILFCAGLGYALLHRRTRPPEPSLEHDRRRTRMILLFGAAIPAVILVPLLLWTFDALAAIDPRARRPDLVVDIVGKQWWWEIRYRNDSVPGQGFVTANELHIPVGRRVEVRLTSTDVIHSFWVPDLQGKTDLIPGRENVTWIEASQPGVYGGHCAEYCGTQHAHMGLLVVAQPAEEFEAWAAQQRRPAASPADSATELGRQAFLSSACARCHAVRGTTAGARLGPDLTHIAGRRTLAAGTIPNTPGHLGGWIAQPQALKPGTHMPQVPMSPEEFRRIHHYLLSLR